MRSFRINAQADCSGTRPASDEFTGTALDVCRWTTILRETPSGYRVREGALEIDAVPGDMYGGDASARNVILQDAPSGGWEAITKVKLPQGDEFEQAGLIAHNSDATFSKLVLMDIPGLGWRAEFGQNLDGAPIFDEALDRSGPLPASINETGIWLRLQSTGAFLLGAWSADGVNWTPFGRSRSQTTPAHRPGRLQRQRAGGGVRLLPARAEGRAAAVPVRRDARGRLPDAVRRHADEPEHLADGGPRRLRAAAGLLDPELRRPRPPLSPGQLRVLLAQARLEDGRRRQRRRVRRLQGPGHRSVQRRQQRPRDPDRRHRRSDAHDRRDLQLPGRGGGRA